MKLGLERSWGGRGTLNRLLFVTNNRDKFREVELIANEYGIEVEQAGIDKLEIQSEDLVKIAKVAAFNAYLELGEPVLVEDAGLFVNALNGFPGPYSSFVYKTIGCKGLLKLLEGVYDRSAFFRSAAVLIHEPYVLTSIGEAHGCIAREARGVKGFGFDPIFVPEGADRTFGEMDVEEKNRYSHRGRSISKVFKQLLTLIYGKNIE